MDKKDKKTKAQELAEKMEAQRVGRAAFEAGKRPVTNVEDPADVPQEAAEPVQEPQEAQPVDVSPSDAEKPSESQETAEKAEPEQEIISAFLREIEAEKREERETYSVHTTVAVKKELDKRAKKAGMSRGAYLDKLLKRAFGLN